jgi:serine/arginine repetitive matrix protein 2
MASAPPTLAASTAAAQAFAASQANAANLAAGAAAAALRSQTSSPVPVGNVQTRRMVRRGSMTSNGSGAGPVERRGSIGSMTERTFRSPSPGGGPQSALPNDAPPMPQIPKAYTSPKIRQQSPKRPSSVEPPPVRLVSPEPRQTGARVLSLDRGPAVKAGNFATSQTGKQAVPTGASPAQSAALRGAMNFSRPLSPTNSSPTSPVSPTSSTSAKRATNANGTTTAARPTAPAGTMSTIEVQNVQNSMQAAADAPVKKKKKKSTTPAVGAHLEVAGLGNPSNGSASGTPERAVTSTKSGSSPTQSTSTQGMPKKNKKVTQIHGSASDSESSEQGSDRPRKSNTRAAGILQKQPSIVREDREQEEEEERVTATKKSKVTTQNGIAKGPTSGAVGAAALAGSRPIPARTTSANQNANTSAVDGTPTTGLQATRSPLEKRISLSPGRSARFSMRPTYETPNSIKHEPPERSMSPAKSALKHSPSSRGTSPIPAGIAGSRSGLTMSETSDNLSVASGEGSEVAGRRKSVRVSFDDEPKVVGLANRSLNNPDSPMIWSPQHKDPAKKGWFNLGRDKKKPLPTDDEILKPTPALPSFGSVRTRGESPKAASPVEILAKETAAYTQPQSLGASNDHVVGAILVQDFASKDKVASAQSQADPLAPEVTSKEGTGEHSDTEGSSYSEDEATNHEARAGTPPSSEIPSIAILPATPGFDNMNTRTEEWLGPIETDEHEPAALTKPSTTAIESHRPNEVTPASAGIAEPLPEEAAPQHDPSSPAVGHVADSLSHVLHSVNDGDESDDSGNSVYSDAPEEVEEGDGFGSINAIVDSPTRAPAMVLPSVVSAVAPAAKESVASTKEVILAVATPTSPEPKAEGGWDRAQAYWSGLTQVQKAKLEQEAAASKETPSSNTTEPSSVDSTPSKPPAKTVSKPVAIIAVLPPPEIAQVISEAPAPIPKKKKTVKTATAQAATPVQQSNATTIRTEPASAPRPVSPVPAMRKSMRQQAEPAKGEVHMRSSMRAEPPPSAAATPPKSAMKQSMRPKSAVISSGVPDTPSPPTRKTRPVSKDVVTNGKASMAGSATRQRPMSAGNMSAPRTPAPPMPALRRQASDGSDSSFKKSRPTTSDNGGRYSMKRSMRANSVGTSGRPQSEYIPASSSRFSVRSLSPVGSATRRPFSGSMRTSMRGSMEPERPQSPVRSLFGRSSKPKASKAAAPRLGRRYSDSSDEVPRTFNSRFADSSDEDDEPVGRPLSSSMRNSMRNSHLAPVAVPKRIEEADSTDLDSDVDKRGKKTAPKPILVNKNKTTGQTEGSILASGSLRASFIPPVPEPSSPIQSADLQAALASKYKEKNKRSFFGLGRRRNDDSKIGKANIESAARRDTALERTNLERSRIPSIPVSPENKGPSPFDMTPVGSRANSQQPKLQRRVTPRRTNSSSWPLPENPISPDSAPASAPPKPYTPAINTLSPNTSTTGRPVTSDGVAFTGATRPSMGGRQITGETFMTTRTYGTSFVGPDGVAYGRNGKKKRFQGLRRAFGLVD